jgi:RNA polymerase sigma factor (sigma-70 family)
VDRAARLKIMHWVGREVLPHEADLRRFLYKNVAADDVEDVIQEAYCRISALAGVDHIQSGRAYLFTAAKMILIDRMRRARIVSIEQITEIDSLHVVDEQPSAERVLSGRRELARVRALIDELPEQCRTIFRMRKIDGLAQSEVAQALGLPEHKVENDIKKGLKLILKSIADGERAADKALRQVGHDDDIRNRRTD